MENESNTQEETTLTLRQQQRARFAPQLLFVNGVEESMERAELLVDYVLNGLPVENHSLSS